MAGVIQAMSSWVSDRNSSLGAKSDIVVGMVLRLCGHTSWQVSQPYTLFPTAAATHCGKSPRRSINWHDRHCRASSAAPSCSAPPGQAASHRWQSPQVRLHGSSGFTSSVVTSSPRKKNDPRPGNIKALLRPMNPMPAFLAQYRSRNGAVSTHGRDWQPVVLAINEASSSSLSLSTS